jgi:hypothetical protein
MSTRGGWFGPLILLPAILLAACASMETGLELPRQAPPEPGAVDTLNRMASNDCNPQLTSSLAGARIPIADVRGLSYGLYRDARRGDIVGYDAWVALRDQPGAIIVQLNADCSPRQIYARDGARMPQPQG